MPINVYCMYCAHANQCVLHAGIPASSLSSYQASMIDLAPTILALAGGTIPQDVDGAVLPVPKLMSVYRQQYTNAVQSVQSYMQTDASKLLSELAVRSLAVPPPVSPPSHAPTRAPRRTGRTRSPPRQSSTGSAFPGVSVLQPFVLDHLVLRDR